MNGSIVTEAVVSFADLVGTMSSGIVAQATGPATNPSFIQQIFGSGFLIPALVIFMLWMFMLKSSRRKEEGKKKELLSALKRGDRVQTIGGILGKVVEVEKEKVLLKVDESSNTKIWFSRNAIFRVVAEEKTEKGDKNEKPEQAKA